MLNTVQGHDQGTGTCGGAEGGRGRERGWIVLEKLYMSRMSIKSEIDKQQLRLTEAFDADDRG